MRSLFAVCFVLFFATSEACPAGCPNGPCGIVNGVVACTGTATGSSTPTKNTGGKRSDLEARTITCPTSTTNLFCRLSSNSSFTDCDCGCVWNTNITVDDNGRVCLTSSDCATSGPVSVTCVRTAPRNGEIDVCSQPLNALATKWGPQGSFSCLAPTCVGFSGPTYDGYSYGNYLASAPHTVPSAWDGVPSTFYDATVATATGCFAEWDMGQKGALVSALRYIIRPTHASYWGYRYVDHTVWASNDANFGTSSVQIGTTGSAGATVDYPGWNYFIMNPKYSTSRFRYYKVIGNNYCNWGELQFLGCQEDTVIFQLPTISKGSITPVCFSLSPGLTSTSTDPLPCGNATVYPAFSSSDSANYPQFAPGYGL